ncbi:MAG: NADAR family protein [Synergistaceae bacterium]|nr:NADAR family protein [Synergistaceae bacterium]
MNVIDDFEGAYEFLSNFHESPVMYDGIQYGSSEAAFQAAKTLDIDERRSIAKLSPDEAKHAGRSLTLRNDWENVKVSIMEEVLRAKFTHHPELLQKLLATEKALLVEGNDWLDTFWGFDVNLGYGANMLGQLLMKIRADHQEH